MFDKPAPDSGTTLQSMNRIQSPTLDMRFCWPWRPYQRRALDAMEAHLRDKRLHIVAAPGSGKTILGLEVFRLLGKPAVILSPTVTVRDQWLARLEHFLPNGSEAPPDWARRDLDTPGFLTSTTYQALHTRYRRAEKTSEEDAVDSDPVDDQPLDSDELQQTIRRFEEIGVGTLILDEAHHLTREWWKALSKLADAIENLTIISLTATPPYDVTGSAWQKYEELCGPIDEEISVPELVKSGTLCPHQDYVWAVRPSESDSRAIRDYDEVAEAFLEEMLTDDSLLAAILSHPWMKNDEADLETMMEDPETAVSMLVYLKARQQPLSEKCLRLLNAKAEDIPATSRRWWQLLLSHYLWDNGWASCPDRESHRDRLAKQLRSSGLLWRRELRLEKSRPVTTSLSQTPTKIDSCLEIYDLERDARGAALRQVMLTDFIRDDDLSDSTALPENRLGAWPLFRALATHAQGEDKSSLALLTGRLAVIHEDRVQEMRSLLGPKRDRLSTTELADLPRYVRIALDGSLVGPFTELLNRGKLQVIVGTRALLGEGWDAPSVNCLVLASYVGAFVTTNQMRGRAIRKSPTEPEKVASIWHLVAIEPETHAGRADAEAMYQRFTTFVGLASSKPVVQSGIERLELPEPVGRNCVEKINAETKARFSGHHHIAEKWQTAIDAGEQGRMVPSVVSQKPPSLKRFFFRDTLKYLLLSALATAIGTFSAVWESVARAADDARSITWAMIAASIIALIVLAPKLIRAGRLYIKHLPVDGSVREMAEALKEALCRTGYIETNEQVVSVRSTHLADGVVTVSLAESTFRESALFADCMQELLGQIENPRYLLTRSSKRSFGAHEDYHAVPQILGSNKELAKVLHERWKMHLGGGELIYTRTSEGRRALLAARCAAFSSAFVPGTKRLDRWQ